MDDLFKKGKLEGLREAVEKGLADRDVFELLEMINSKEALVTTSSCSGRIQLIQAPDTGNKVDSAVLGKWHRSVSERELNDALDRWGGDGVLLLLAQPMLLHVRARDLPSGVNLRNMGQECGLKLSSIRSVRMDIHGRVERWGVTVELMGTERMEIPLQGIPADLLKEGMGPWIDYANSLMCRTKEHIARLTRGLEETGTGLQRESGP